MSYQILLRNNLTKEERLVEYLFPWGEASDYLWTEGSCGCDCNRHLLFERANGIEPSDHFPCGYEKYSALYALLPDGTRHELDAN